jgi:molybdate transport system substrate-binding protein
MALVVMKTRRGALGRPSRGSGEDGTNRDHHTSIAPHKALLGLVDANVQDRQAAGQIGGSMRPRSIAAAFGLLWLGFAGSAEAAKTHVAVAANFTEPAREIAARFREKTGHEAVLIFGASGAFLTQITHDAPFEVFLSADEERPRLAVEQGFAVADSRFTYAIGKLVLWSRVLDVTDGRATLSAHKFSKLAIANPKSAPYGAAAVETMKALGVFDALQRRLV